MKRQAKRKTIAELPDAELIEKCLKGNQEAWVKGDLPVSYIY